MLGGGRGRDDAVESLLAFLPAAGRVVEAARELRLGDAGEAGFSAQEQTLSYAGLGVDGEYSSDPDRLAALLPKALARGDAEAQYRCELLFASGDFEGVFLPLLIGEIGDVVRDDATAITRVAIGVLQRAVGQGHAAAAAKLA